MGAARMGVALPVFSVILRGGDLREETGL